MPSIEWKIADVAGAASSLNKEHVRGFTLDDLLDQLTDFSMYPHFEKMWLGGKLRELGYANKLIAFEGTKTNRWFKCSEASSELLSPAMLDSLGSHSLMGSSPATPRQLERKPLRLPAEKWDEIRVIKEEVQRLHPHKRVTLSSTVESLIEFALQNATTEAE